MTEKINTTNFLQFSRNILEIDGLSIQFPGEVNPDQARSIELREDRARFWNLLVTYTPKSNFQVSCGEDLYILDVGCGICNEAIVLSSFFSGNGFEDFSSSVGILGIDLHEGLIESAKASVRLINQGNEDRLIAKFVCGDATNLSQYPQVPDALNIIVIRHQELINGSKVWRSIIEETFSRLKANGLGIITSYSKEEQASLKLVLSDLDLQILVNEKNIHGRPTRVEGVTIDNFITIVGKKVDA